MPRRRRRSPAAVLRHAALRSLAAAALGVGVAAACSPSSERQQGRPDFGDAVGQPRERTSSALPPLEFLVAAGDSTFWVRTGPAGATVRGAPLTLARYGGRFYEIYVGDDDRSFYDAVFVGQRVFRRDIVSGDSALVFADSAVLRAARRYAAAHPEETPLGDDEDASESPHSSLTSEIQLLDALGPFVTFDFRTRREVRGDVEDATSRRGVLDLRDARLATVADVVGGPRAAATLLGRGRRLFAEALDSVRAAHDERALAAQRALGGFAFDPTSFGVLAVDGAPAIAFVGVGRDGEAAGYTLPLPPVVLEPAPSWWNEVRASLADTASSPRLAGADHWRRRDADVSARYDSAAGAYALFVHASSPRGSGDWPLRLVQGPVRQLYWLDAPSVDSTVRRALARAFDESALYSDEARTVAWRHGASRGAGKRWAGSGRREPFATMRAVARQKGHASRRADHRL
ncbi:MAG TPA: hypothetical protein VFJ74_01835 [Gemmatimonadaceae bacterium]|nr:hypothetical protein [Gemmatimonadaceae bacterium]